MKKLTKKLVVACLALLSCVTLAFGSGCADFERVFGGLGGQISDVIFDATHEHTFNQKKFDKNSHWNECACGEKETEPQAHLGGEATCTKKAVCSVCKQAYGELKAHDYATVKYDANSHWFECVCGKTDGKEAHKGGTATTTAQAKCEVCEQAYGELVAEYTLTIIGYNPSVPRWDMTSTYSVTLADGSAVKMANPTAAGYAFTGYVAYDDDGNEVVATLPETLTEDVTVFATWVVTTYNTVTMNFADGTVEYIYFGSATGMTADGKMVESIDGMNWSVSFRADWVEAVPETFEATNYIFNEKVYTLKVENLDPTKTYNNSYAVSGILGTEVNFEISAVKGYTFAGYTDAEGKAVTLPETLTEDLTVYASWTLNIYTLTVVDYNGEETAYNFAATYAYGVVTVNELAEILAGNLTESDEFTTYAWAEEVPATFELQNYTFTEVETRAQFDLMIRNYNPKMGPMMGNYYACLDWGTAIDVATPASETGLTFLGYFVYDEEGNEVEATLPEVMPKEGIYLFAKWEVTPYTLTVTYPEVCETENVEITFGVVADSMNGIYDTAESLAWIMEGLLPESNEQYNYTWDKELPAAFKAQDYNFTVVATKVEYTYMLLINPMDRMGGIQFINLPWGEAMPEIADPTADGKIFLGWMDVEENAIELPETMPIGGGAAYANWEVIPYTLTIVDLDGNETEVVFGVTYDFANGIEISVNDLAYVLKENLPVNTKEYAYSWEEEVPAMFELKDYTFTVAKTEVKYTYIVMNYNPTAWAMEANAMLVITAAWGEEMAIATPAYEGLTFLGWTDAEGNAVELATTMPIGGGVIYAKWEVTPYTVTIMYPASYDYKMETITFGAAADKANGIVALKDLAEVVAAMLPEETETYTYSWSGELPKAFELQDYFFMIDETNTEYTYTLIINPMDRMNGMQFVTAPWGDAFPAVEDPTMAGKIFLGWVDVEGNAVALPETMPFGGGAAFASWEVIPYTLTMIDMQGNETEVVFGVDYDFANGIEATINDLSFILDMNLPTEQDYAYSWKGVPTVWEAQDYEVQLTKKYVTPAANSELSIARANLLASQYASNKYTAGKYYVTGTIVGNYSNGWATYGNFYIKDENGNQILIYGLYSADGKTRYDKMTTKPVYGTTITVYGQLGTYNGTNQMKNGWLQEIIDVESEADATLTAWEAFTYGGTFAVNTFSTDKYYVTGTISSLASTTYGNMYIKDASGNEFYIYGTWSADGETRYDKLTEKPAVGDVVTIYGSIGKKFDSYSTSSIQMLNGWITEFYTPDSTKLEKEANQLKLDKTGFNEVGNVNLPYTATTYEEVVITWALEENAYATVANNVLTINALPEEKVEITLTATLAIGETTVTKNFKIKIVDGVLSEPVTATLSFANKAQRTSFSTSQQIWKQNGITVTNNKAASTSNVADYANPARFYASSSLEVAYEGKVLTKIEFTCNSSSYATALKNSIGTMAGVTVAVSGSKVTVTFATPVASFMVAKLSAQVRINSLTVWAE